MTPGATTRRRLAGAAALLATALAAAPASAAAPIEGSLRGAYYSSSARFDGRDDVASGALWLKSTPSLGEDSRLVLEGWVRNDDAWGRGATEGRLREAYLRTGAGELDLRLGQQLIIWGRADRVNPTDNVTPRDYTMLTPEDVDQRRGVLAASAAYHWDGASLSAYWLPSFRPNVLPIAPVPNVRLREETPHAAQGALKFDASGGAIDWSLSYYNGLDVNPDLRLDSAGPGGVELTQIHRRVRILGADAATVAGRYGLRAEAAYTWTDGAARGSADPLVKKPFLYLVAGGDRTWGDNFNVNLQYYLRRVAGYQDPRTQPDALLRALAIQGALGASQLERWQHGLTYRIANKWLNDTVEAELAGIVSLSKRDWAFKPRLSYAISDQWRVTAGMNWFRGEKRHIFRPIGPDLGRFCGTEI